ncbi:MAG: MucB/RseB C-terminal domain-containing protein [Enterovibrio sp.]
MIKGLLLTVIMLINAAVFAAEADDHAVNLLAQMERASEQFDYDISYILVQKKSIEPLRYRHAKINGKNVSHLQHLSGPVREIILRGEQVSYFDPNIEPVTILSKQMVAPIPILLSNFKELSSYYHILSQGRGREAGRACDVVRIVPKDGERYAYLLWLDADNHLLVRADLLDRDGELIEQVRALSIELSDKVKTELKSLLDVNLPPVLHSTEQRAVNLNWQVTSLPEGFKLVSSNRYRLLATQRQVESQIFSDGLFNFAVYLAKADEFSLRDQMVRSGKRSLFTRVIDDLEVTVVGDIPVKMAKQLAKSVHSRSDNKPVTKHMMLTEPAK